MSSCSGTICWEDYPFTRIDFFSLMFNLSRSLNLKDDMCSKEDFLFSPMRFKRIIDLDSNQWLKSNLYHQIKIQQHFPSSTRRRQEKGWYIIKKFQPNISPNPFYLCTIFWSILSVLWKFKRANKLSALKIYLL